MRRSLGMSLMIGVLALIALMVVQAVIGLAVVRNTWRASEEITADLLPSTRLLGEIGVEATRYRLRGSRHAATDDPERMRDIERQMNDATVELGKLFVRYVTLLSNDPERRSWQAFVDDWGTYVIRQEAAVAMSRAGDKSAASEMLEDSRDFFLATMNRLKLEAELLDSAAARATADIRNSHDTAIVGVALIGCFAVLCGFIVWLGVARDAASSLRDLTEAMRAIADGQLAAPIPALDRQDEIGHMAKALVFFRDHFHEAEELREQQQALDLANLKMMNEAQEQLALQAQFLDLEVNKKAAELMAREREIVWRLSRATERRDNETGDHIVRMARISGVIAEALGMTEEDCGLVEIAAQMHDIGKVGISDQILFKAGPLTPEERKVMETHALIGWNILKGSESRLIRMAADVAVSHHEKWDGTGYPHGLAGEDIPIAGRISALADVFDALMSRRPYKEPWPLEKARAFVLENSGKHFDPSCVAAFMARWDEISAIAGTSASEDGALRLTVAA